MVSENFTEAERQVLIACIELSEPIETPNNNFYNFYPKTVEEAAAYFRGLREDWSQAYIHLQEQGLLVCQGSEYRLSEQGLSAARRQRLDHPPIWYWYREFFPMAARSQAYRRFCEQIYGCNLYQAGFSDQQQIDYLIRVGKINAQSMVLDLGCGLGGVAEYISDQTGASATGLDYIPEAVSLALERTQHKADRLNYVEGNLDHLLEGWNEHPQQFDTLVSIDSIYMPNQLSDTLLKMKRLLKPEGQMLIYYSYFAFDPQEPRSVLSADASPLAQVIQSLGWSYEVWDFTEEVFNLMRRKRKLAKEMKSEFEAEDSMMLFEFLYNESDGGEGLFNRTEWCISRYLYKVRF